MMKTEEFEGKSVEQAIEEASKYFRVAPEDLHIEVITHGSTGLFGIGAKKARIKARLKSEKLLEQRASLAQQILNEILAAAEFSLHINQRLENETIKFDITGKDKDLLLLRGAAPLNALEYLINKIVARRMGVGERIVLDIENFRARQEKKIKEIARRAAERAKKIRRPVELKPMPSHERRLVHIALRSFPGVQTRSRGRGDARRVIIYPESSRRK